MKTIYDITKESFGDSGLLPVQNVLERFSCSIGCHLMNLVNSEKRIFFHASKLQNFREHIVFQAPSGFMKSVIMDFFLDSRTGLLSSEPFPTNVEATFTPESWIGTMNKGKGGTMDISDGVFERYKTGIIGADEYSRLKTMAENPGEANDVVYLLKALDDGNITKNMAYDQLHIENICTTFWCGLRPNRLNFTSGLGRRFTYQIFFPTWKETQDFKRANVGGSIGVPITQELKEQLREKTLQVMTDIGTCNVLDTSNIDDWMIDNDLIPHFDMPHYKRLAVGWSVINDTYPNITLDDTLIELFRDEFNARNIIRNNPIEECSVKVIGGGYRDDNGFPRNVFYEFMDAYYQMPRKSTKTTIRSLKRSDRIYEKHNKFFVSEDEVEDQQDRQQVLQDYITIG